MQKNINVIYQKIKANFERKGYINLNHIQIDSREKLAELGQIFRDPRYETFRMIYMKGNKIVGQEAISSKIPGATAIFPGNKIGRTRTEQGIYKMKDRMRRLDADGYYMIHNHPSGRAKASQQDINMTYFFFENLKGFRGHLIVNSNSYAWIEVKKDEIYITNEKPIRGKGKRITKQAEKKGIFDIHIKNRKDLIYLMNHIKNTNCYSTAIVTDMGNIPRMVLDIPNKFLNMSNQQLRGYFQNIGRQNGGASVFLVTNDKEVCLRGFELMEDGILRDCVLYEIMENNLILVESPHLEENLYKKTRLFKNKEGKAIRVCEGEEKYMQEMNIENIENEENEEEYKREEFLKILYKAVGDLPKVMKIENTLEAKQELVGGLIEVIPYKDALLICNEEGKIDNLPINLVFDLESIAGNCFAVGDDYLHGDFKSLTDEQIEEFRKDFIRRSYKEKTKTLDREDGGMERE